MKQTREVILAFYEANDRWPFLVVLISAACVLFSIAFPPSALLLLLVNAVISLPGTAVLVSQVTSQIDGPETGREAAEKILDSLGW